MTERIRLAGPGDAGAILVWMTELECFMRDGAPLFSLSDACRRAGTATPEVQRTDRRSIRTAAAILLILCFPAARVGGAKAFAVCVCVAALTACALGYRRIVRHRRRRKLWNTPFPPEHEFFLFKEIPHYRYLDDSGRELFRQRAKIFLDEVVFHGAGVKADDSLRLRAAAAAVIPTLGFQEWQWLNLREIIFRPKGYAHGSYTDEDGVVTEFAESGMIGDAGIFSGVMMLSSEDLIEEFAHPGEGANVGFHEFAHLMQRSGDLRFSGQDRINWEKALGKHRRLFRKGRTLLDDYGLLNENEFFAVSSELFFTVPHVLRDWHRGLYARLGRVYRQQPHLWLPDFSKESAKEMKKNKRGRKRLGKSGGGAATA